MFADPDECYLYAYTCLQYAFYTECIDWCDGIISNVKGMPHSLVNLVRGKAYAHIHKRQMWHILKNEMLDVAVPWKSGDFVDRCASNAKKVIGDLGFALDQGVLDEDGSYLLDMAMLNHVLIKKKLKDFQRCLLCRRKGVKLKESHTIPKFLLKDMSNRISKSLKDDLDNTCFFNRTKGKFKADTPNTSMKYTMLCERCEQCLSQNGEDQFRKEFLPLIYSDSEEVQTVKYDSTIYSFCLGILFRSFANDASLHFANADEIYSLLVACRQHLIHLPTKVTEKKEIPNPPPVDGIRPIPLPATYLIINPFKLHTLNFNLGFLASMMTYGFGTSYLTTCLNKEPKTHLCHAVMVHMGVCNIVVPFSPAKNALLDESYRIHPQEGVYPILPDMSRWKTTPPGVFKMIVDNSILSARQYQQVLSGMKTTKRDSRKAETFIQGLEKASNILSLEHRPIDVASLKSMPIPLEEVDLISSFVSRSDVVQVELLPEGFHMSYNPPKLTLKEGYMLLYHIRDNDTNMTFFFAANSSDVLTGKLIVIMTVIEEAENYKRVEGVHLHINMDGSVCVEGYLQEPTTERLKQSQMSRFGTITERVMKAVDMLLQRCGTSSMFLLYASVHTRLAHAVYSVKYGIPNLTKLANLNTWSNL